MIEMIEDLIVFIFLKGKKCVSFGLYIIVMEFEVVSIWFWVLV